MGNQKLKGKDLNSFLSDTTAKSLALGIVNRILKKHSKEEKINHIRLVVEQPEAFLDDTSWSKLAQYLLPNEEDILPTNSYQLKEDEALFPVYGRKNINIQAIQQMEVAMRLPIAQKGALMPDAHSGYGLPIGGVLATKNEIIPYAVGVDIGCRMSLSLYDLPEKYLTRYDYQLKKVLKEFTAFGMSEQIPFSQEHEILERKEFQETKFLRKLHGKAVKQLGSSGGGNHFVEWGNVLIHPNNTLGIPAGHYVGILAHSGSRGLGANIAKEYTQRAAQLCKLPKQAQHLAWLDLNSEAGQEYWIAMNLAGDYAKACHDRIHINLAKAMGIRPIAKIENHHNFAWKEKQKDGEEWLIHRKGATPAQKDVLGIIPSSMATPAYIVSGKGNEDSLQSASHGAGRVMSRSKAKSSITKSELKKRLKHTGIHLIGGDVDEAPMVYKNIEQVMYDQKDLVEIQGEFHPKIIRMAKD